MDSVKIDARKFVKLINNGAQSRIAFFEDTIRNMGRNFNKNWKLTSLDANYVIFEDVDSNKYYIANVSKKNGKTSIENVKPVSIVEQEKSDLFNANCSELVEAISEGKFADADRAFKKIESQRFRSNIIPESCMITTKDGIARKIIPSNRALKENYIPRIIARLVESLKSTKTEVVDGKIIKYTINENKEKIVLPINEYTKRRLNAKKMKFVAENAYKHSSFCKLIEDVNDFIKKDDMFGAVQLAASFLKEEQEFCLLSKAEMKKLVENVFATQCNFNNNEVTRVATLLYKTNLNANRISILETWSRISQVTNNSILANNTVILESSDDFEKDYDKFLGTIFNEGSDILTTKAKAYAVTMKTLASVLDIEGEEDTKSEMEQMAADLTDKNVDSETVGKAEELLAGLDDQLVDQALKLVDFESSEDEEETDDDDDEDDDEDSKVIPLPEAGSDNSDPGEDSMPGTGPDSFGGPKMESVMIKDMTVNNLKEDLQAWKTNGHIYIMEDGYDDCFKQLNKYVKRCDELGNDVLKEEFSNIMNVMVQTGNDVVEDETFDPYSKSYNSIIENFGEGPQPSKLRMDELQKGKGFVEKPKEHSGSDDCSCVEPAEDATVKGAVKPGNKTRMSELQTGKSVADKSVKSVSGTDGDSAESAQDYTISGGLKGSGSIRMNDLQGKGGIKENKLTKMSADFMGDSSVQKRKATESDVTPSNDSGVAKGSKQTKPRMNELQKGSDISSKSGSLKGAGVKMSEFQGTAGLGIKKANTDGATATGVNFKESFETRLSKTLDESLSDKALKKLSDRDLKKALKKCSNEREHKLLTREAKRREAAEAVEEGYSIKINPAEGTAEISSDDDVGSAVESILNMLKKNPSSSAIEDEDDNKDLIVDSETADGITSPVDMASAPEPEGSFASKLDIGVGVIGAEKEESESDEDEDEDEDEESESKSESESDSESDEDEDEDSKEDKED